MQEERIILDATQSYAAQTAPAPRRCLCMCRCLSFARRLPRLGIGGAVPVSIEVPLAKVWMDGFAASTEEEPALIPPPPDAVVARIDFAEIAVNAPPLDPLLDP